MSDAEDAVPRDDRPELRSGGQWPPAIAFLTSTAAAIGLAAVYTAGGQAQLEGILLSVALGGIGIGLVLWVKRFMPEGPEAEPRGRIGSTEEEIAAFTQDFETGSTT